MVLISRYVFLFHKGDERFLYNARTNSFYHLNQELYFLLSRMKSGETVENSLYELDSLRERKILVDEYEDNRYRDFLKIAYLKNAFGSDCLSLTIVPTVTCNLRCPYCFEESKPVGIMNDETIEKLIRFIKINAKTGKISITWFGGEPLLGVNAIEKILRHLSEDKDIKLISHSIVTNGTLLNAKARDIFKKYPLDKIQITFDGLPHSHDSKRFFESGQGSFDVIIKNVNDFIKENKDTHISFRVNVDNDNKHEYTQMHRFLHENFKDGNISVYPALLRANKGCESETFMTTEDHLEFCASLWRNKIEDIYPSKCSKGFCATSISSHVVGPKGELYVCWEHVGKNNKIVGYVDGKSGDAIDLYAIYKLHGHCFEDQECLKCGLLPLCGGGCADKRIRNMIEGENNNLCSIYHEKGNRGLEDTLYEYFQNNRMGSI